MSLLSELQRRAEEAERQAQRSAAAHLKSSHARNTERAMALRECIDLVVEHVGVTPVREDGA